MKSSRIPIPPPFFEIGPKTYLYGSKMLALARAVDGAVETLGVRVILTPQYVDIPLIAGATKNVYVFAQHMDPNPPGRGIGRVLAEALKEAGAQGVLLNHAECKMTVSDLRRAIDRAREVGLATMVCADNTAEVMAVAQFAPDIILAEPESLIGTSGSDISARAYVTAINEMVKKINPKIQILHGGGISCPNDAADIIRLGADATGCTSAVVCKEDPISADLAMLRAVGVAWEERGSSPKKSGAQHESI
jgi:triosephosphate isomerase